jgi:hypothetical protein
MIDRTSDLDRAEEENLDLFAEVSDEALEAAAGIVRAAATDWAHYFPPTAC